MLQESDKINVRVSSYRSLVLLVETQSVKERILGENLLLWSLLLPFLRLRLALPADLLLKEWNFDVGDLKSLKLTFAPLFLQI